MSTLLVQASARSTMSVSRRLAERLARRLGGPLVVRDLSDALPFVDETWTVASYLSPEQRTPEQAAALDVSDRLVAELVAAERLVIGTPVYNFGVPAALKAWMDQVARAGLTFAFTPTGPRGLLKDKSAWIVVASGSTPVGGPGDHLTPHLQQFLAFLGIGNIEVIKADGLVIDGAAEARAEARILELQV